MIINIKNKTDLITLDLSLKQIRYILNHYSNKIPQDILFLNLSSNDVEGYEYLFNKDKSLFLKALKEDIQDDLINVNLNDLEILK